MNDAWRIDSIDARAGLAFASWRASDLDVGSIDLEKPAFFLSPPFFQPEAVSSRSIGFSAARGRAQLGVFVGGAELAFETLEDLAEFVRRTYIGSGSGDTGGGGGGLAPPPIPDEPPPEGPTDGLGITEERAVGHPTILAANGAAEAAANLAFTAGLPVKTHRLNIDNSTAVSIATSTPSLVDGITEVVLELLRRFPMNRDESVLEIWSRSAQSVGAAINRVDHWRDVLDGPNSSRFDRLVVAILQLPADLQITSNQRYLLPTLFGSGPLGWVSSIDDLSDDHLSYMEYIARRGAFFSANLALWDVGDPIDQLALWPLPTDIRELITSSQTDPSAFALMCAVNANPAILVKTSSFVAFRSWSILHFAAAYLIAESQPPPRGSWLLPEMQEGARHALLKSAGNWILQQWPKLIYPKLVEQVIQEATELSP